VDDETPPAPEPAQRPPGRVSRASAWSKAKGAQATAWAEEARETRASVDVGFRIADREKQVAAGVLAGGVAYRFFFWLLAAALLAGGALGFFNANTVEGATGDRGIAATLANAVGDSVRESEAARWWLVAVGGWLTLWTGYMGAKALVLVHATVWGVPSPRVRNALRASLVFTGAAVALFAAMAGARWLRDETGLVGLLITLFLFAIPFVFWLAASRALPNRAAGWTDLVPGAALVAVGVQALHLFTVFFLGPKLDSATDLYGGIGVATTMLFWLYIIGRLVIAAATLNASLVERREAGPARP